MSNLSESTKSDMIFTIRVSDEDSHGQILKGGKVHLHGETYFFDVLRNAGFAIKEKRMFKDSKPGKYLVVWAYK